MQPVHLAYWDAGEASPRLVKKEFKECSGPEQSGQSGGADPPRARSGTCVVPVCAIGEIHHAPAFIRPPVHPPWAVYAPWCIGLLCACLVLPAAADTAAAPDSKALLGAQADDANWILPGKTYQGNRYTALSQIDRHNVGTLGKAWRTNIADDGEQEASPIVYNGVMYISTPHDGVLALDAASGKLIWQARLQPRLRAVLRGEPRRRPGRRQAIHRHPGLPRRRARCEQRQDPVERARFAATAATASIRWQPTSFKDKVIVGTGRRRLRQHRHGQRLQHRRRQAPVGLADHSRPRTARP